MARRVTWGTPSRTEHYLHPRPAYALVLASLALGGFALFAFGVFQVAGVRTPLSPGDVTSGHANYDARCEACHARGQGVANLRCQRCHDSGGMGRLTHPAHVFFGSGDPRKADPARNLACARCHVEHRGSDARLRVVNEAQCRRCHGAWNPASEGLAYRIGSFAAHPEFKLLRENLQGDPRLLFSHKRHMREMIKDGAPGEWESCGSCHKLDGAGGSDFGRILYGPHCGRCHDESELTMPPVPARDVVEDVGLRGAMGAFNRTDTTLQRVGMRHADEWVLYNLRRLQWELYPDVYARDRGALEAQASRLERGIAQAQPLVGLGPEALAEREAALLEEIRRLEARAQAQESGGDGAAGLARVAEVVAAAGASAEPGVQAAAGDLRARAEALRSSGAPSAALPEEDFEARRRELLAVLEALAAADPSRKRTVGDLRRRLLALVPGEAGRENVARALRQRRGDLARVRDEKSLRASGVRAEGRTLPELTALRDQLAEVQTRLTRFYNFEGAPPALAAEDRARKEQTLRGLTGEGTGERCAKCHLVEKGSVALPRPARSVLVRARFTHRKHQVAPLPEPGLWRRLAASLPGRAAAASSRDALPVRCAYCHEGIVKAADAPRKPAVPGVANCRECHRTGATRADCQLCHRYHPPADAS